MRYPIALSTFRSATGNSGLFRVMNFIINSIDKLERLMEFINKSITLNRPELPVADRNVLRAMGISHYGE